MFDMFIEKEVKNDFVVCLLFELWGIGILCVCVLFCVIGDVKGYCRGGGFVVFIGLLLR